MQIGTRLAAVTVSGIMACALAFGQATEPPEDVRAVHSRSTAFQAEKELFAEINRARRDQGLAPLHWNDSLAAAARRHAAVMAEHGEAQHGFAGEPSLFARVKLTGAHFSWLSENVTQGPGAQFIHAQFMKSPRHRANILDTDMNSVGVGVNELGGQLYAVEDFADLH
ncbi:MAG TPA: CAP domain-containing protein [Terriglobales bacterium]|nr:CAP domain-containing protein [Terriglobales bacterium]